MLKLSRPAAEVLIPDGTSWEAACARVTHLVVAAHADGRGSNTRLIADVKQAAYPALASVYTHNPEDLSHTSCLA